MLPPARIKSGMKIALPCVVTRARLGLTRLCGRTVRTRYRPIVPPVPSPAVTCESEYRMSHRRTDILIRKISLTPLDDGR